MQRERLGENEGEGRLVVLTAPVQSRGDRRRIQRVSVHRGAVPLLVVAVEIEPEADALTAEVVGIACLNSREAFDLRIVVGKNAKGEPVTGKIGANFQSARDALSRLVEHLGNGDNETLAGLILNKELDADVLELLAARNFHRDLVNAQVAADA